MPSANSPVELQFFHAISSGQGDIVRALVQSHGELLDAFDRRCFGATPITSVCFRDDREMIRLLIDLGADVNRRSDWEMGPWSPLHCAIMNRNHDLANFLLQHGATLDAHTAAGLGRVDDLRQLLDRHPDAVRESGGDGCQPLHFADSCDVAQLLLDRGADLEARCLDHYSTPVQYLACVRPEVARFLFSRGATPDIFSAVMAGDIAIAQKLISENPEILNTRMTSEFFPPGPEHDVQNIMTFTVGQNTSPLHAAARANQGAMVEVLVSAGLSPNVRGGYDDGTPLHIAAWQNHRDVTKALVEHGADINARSGTIHNNSPAGWAIVAGSDDVFALLMNCGAEVLDWYESDAQAGLRGAFRSYKAVPAENYQRILARLTGSESK